MVTMTVDWCGCVSNGFNKRLLGYSDWELNKKVIWCQLKKIRCNKMLQLQRRLFALQRETIIFDRFKMKKYWNQMKISIVVKSVVPSLSQTSFARKIIYHNSNHSCLISKEEKKERKDLLPNA
jgi:hypothetical protein